MNSNEWHRLSELDLEAKTGVCSIDGPVSIYKKPSMKIWKCVVKRRQDRKEYGERHPELLKQLSGSKDYAAKSRANKREPHGLTVEEARAFREGKVCENPACGSTENLVVDHDHALAESKPRGVLCCNCNLALGNAHDDIKILLGLITYLERAD